MARKTFFSFHYERDAWRAAQVRNCNVVASEDEYGFIDAVEWESIKKQGDHAIKRWITSQLENTTVTTVLIGKETANREWVRHEIVESWNRGNGVIGIWIHDILDQDRKRDDQGRNPFDMLAFADGKSLSQVCKTYNWETDKGRANLGKWLEEAVEIRANYPDDETICEAAEKRAGIGVRSVSRGFVPKSPWCPLAGEPR